MTNFDEFLADYLTTQNIKLNKQAIRETSQILTMILLHGEVDIDSSPIWHSTDNNSAFALSDYLTANSENDLRLRRLYAVCDTVFEQFPSAQQLSLYMLKEQKLIRLIHIGTATEALITVENEKWHNHLAMRCSQTGWFNHTNDIAEWIKIGDLTADRHQELAEVWAYPIVDENGAVLGVLYGESLQHSFLTEEAQVWWLALAVILGPYLKELIIQE